MICWPQVYVNDDPKCKTGLIESQKLFFKHSLWKNHLFLWAIKCVGSWWIDVSAPITTVVTQYRLELRFLWLCGMSNLTLAMSLGVFSVSSSSDHQVLGILDYSRSRKQFFFFIHHFSKMFDSNLTLPRKSIINWNKCHEWIKLINSKTAFSCEQWVYLVLMF